MPGNDSYQMANNFEGLSQTIQDNLQEPCCRQLCVPTTEMEDNQFLAIVLYALMQSTGLDPANATDDEINAAARDAWCAVNMATFCSIPPDRLKAIILWLANEALA